MGRKSGMDDVDEGCVEFEDDKRVLWDGWEQSEYENYVQ
jgi:hypothetical protein